MFVNNINPVFFEIGSVQIRYYGIIYALSFLFTYLFMLKVAKSGKIKNFTEELSETLTIYIIVATVIGARLFEFLFFETQILIHDPIQIFYIWHGGLSFHGALVGMIIAVILFCRKYNIKFYDIADHLVLPGSFFLIFGRIANFINGELPGTPTNVSWCVIFPKVDELCRHPSQLYEALYNSVIFATLYMLYLKKKLKDGILFWTFILMYGILRFFANFLRDDAFDFHLFGLSTGQLLCIPMIIISVIFLYKLNKKRVKIK